MESIFLEERPSVAFPAAALESVPPSPVASPFTAHPYPVVGRTAVVTPHQWAERATAIRIAPLARDRRPVGGCTSTTSTVNSTTSFIGSNGFIGTGAANATGDGMAKPLGDLKVQALRGEARGIPPRGRPV